MIGIKNKRSPNKLIFIRLSKMESRLISSFVLTFEKLLKPQGIEAFSQKTFLNKKIVSVWLPNSQIFTFVGAIFQN